jgi:hypothetical protein
MSRADKERDLQALHDIVAMIAEIDKVSVAQSPAFLQERALERCFEVLGEACRRVSPALQEKYPEVPWGNIISLRNRIIHGHLYKLYFDFKSACNGASSKMSCIFIHSIFSVSIASRFFVKATL